jgi:hypothetical protein
MTKDPLHSAIEDAIALTEAEPKPTDDNLRALSVRLALAHAAAEDEINMLAVESFIETIEDMQADTNPDHRAYLYEQFTTNLLAYEVQLLLDGAKG